jgi:hypothetical protein
MALESAIWLGRQFSWYVSHCALKGVFAQSCYDILISRLSISVFLMFPSAAESPAPVGRPFLATVAVRIPADAASECALPSRYLLVDASTTASRAALARHVVQHAASTSPPPLPLSQPHAAEAPVDVQADKRDSSDIDGEVARQRAFELECEAVLLALNERPVVEGQADGGGVVVLHSWLDLGYVAWFDCPVLFLFQFLLFQSAQLLFCFANCCSRILNAGQTATATLELRAARAGIHCLAHLFVVRINVDVDAEPASCRRRNVEVFAASDPIELQCA